MAWTGDGCGGAAAAGGRPPPVPGPTAWRRSQRRDQRDCLRVKVGALADENNRLLAVCNQLLHSGSGGREAAVLAALRLHIAACRAAGRDAHNASDALHAAAWMAPATREIVLRGAVARHHGLASVGDSTFSELQPLDLRRLQRGARGGPDERQGRDLGADGPQGDFRGLRRVEWGGSHDEATAAPDENEMSGVGLGQLLEFGLQGYDLETGLCGSELAAVEVGGFAGLGDLSRVEWGHAHEEATAAPVESEMSGEGLGQFLELG